MAVTDRVRDLAVRVAQDVRALRTGKADLSVVARRAVQETISAVWTFNAAPVVPVGDQPANPVRRDDSRLVDARDPRPHTHDAGDVASGYLDPARLPAVMSEVRSGSATAALTPSAARTSGGTISNIVLNGNVTIGGPTQPTDGQVLRYRFRAAGADRTLTFAAAASGAVKVVPSTGLTLGPYSVPRGRVLVAALEYVADRRTSADVLDPAWVLTAATVSG